MIARMIWRRYIVAMACMVTMLAGLIHNEAHRPEPVSRRTTMTVEESSGPICETPEQWAGNGWCQFPGVILNLTF